MSYFQAIQATKICFTIFQNEKTFLQPIKKRVSKSRKIEIFSKGYAMVLVKKMANFPCLFFQAIQARKMCFTIFQNKKTPFEPIKTKRSKSQKMAIFPCLLFRQYRPRRFVLQYSRTKKPFFQPIKKKSSKIEKLRFFQKG